MPIEIAKFIPPEMRLEIARRLIAEKGIRPLAREVEVNPKSVYKYKEGTSHPGDEVMSKILAVLKREEPQALDEYLDRLRENFSKAIKAPIDVQEVLSSSREKSTAPALPTPPIEEGAVDRETTSQPPEKSVTQKPTEEEVSIEGICERIGVTSPFNRTKIEKIVNALSETSGLRLDELVEETSLSKDALEKYLGMLSSEEMVERDASGSYGLSIGIREGE